MRKLLLGVIILSCLMPIVGLADTAHLERYDRSEMEYVTGFAVFEDRLFALIDGVVEERVEGGGWRQAATLTGKDTDGILMKRGRALFAHYKNSQELFCTFDGSNWSPCLLDGEPFVGSVEVLIEMGGGFLAVMCRFDDKWDPSLICARSEDGVSFETTYVAVPESGYLSLDESLFYQDKLVLLIEPGWVASTEDGVHFAEERSAFEGDDYPYARLISYGDEALFLMATDYDTEMSSIYVTNDLIHWRLLIADGIEMKDRPVYFYSGHLEENVNDKTVEYESLDNMLPDQPVMLSQPGETHFGERYGRMAELSPEVSYWYTAIDYRLDIQGETFALYSGELQSIHGEVASHERGRMPDLKEAAASASGTLVASGSGGIVVVGTLNKNSIALRPYRFNPDGSGIKMVEYVNDAFYLATYAGGLYRSLDGLDYEGITAMESPISNMMWDGTRYFAASNVGIWSSGDAVNWELVHETPNPVNEVIFGGGLYLACGDRGEIYTSKDGARWKKVYEEPNRRPLYALAYGDGMYVSGGGTGAGGTGVMIGSVDGTAWTLLSDGEEGFSPGENGDILFENCSYAIEYIGGMFVATGLNRVSDGFVMTSADGVAWNKQMHRWGKDVFPLGEKLIGVASHNGVYDESRLALFVPDDVKMNGEIQISFGQVIEDISPSSRVEPLLHAMEMEMDVDTK